MKVTGNPCLWRHQERKNNASKIMPVKYKTKLYIYRIENGNFKGEMEILKENSDHELKCLLNTE